MTSSGNPLEFISQLPADAQALFITGFHAAFTIAIANSMLLGVGAAAAAVVVALLLKEIPLRTSTGAEAAADAKVNPDAAVATRQAALD